MIELPARSKSLFLIFAVVLLASCASDGPETRYLQAQEQRDLTLPPDLVQTEVAAQFRLPEAFLTPADGQRNHIPVVAQLQTARLQGSGDFYWLSVNESVETLYPLVKRFWASEGYRLSVDEPALGIMETAWVFLEVGTNREYSSWIDRLFSSADYAAVQDQFQTRLERVGEDGSRSRIYIAHRGTEFQDGQVIGPQFEGGDESAWNFRQPEPELEIEKLSRLLVFLGLEQSEVTEQVEASKMFAPRASKLFDADEQANYLLINEPLLIAWNKVYHILQRFNYEIDAEREPSGFITPSGFIRVKTAVQESGGGFFSTLFGSDEPTFRSIDVTISEEDNQSSRLILESVSAAPLPEAESEALLDLLYQQLK